jgi:hypothetical protein
MIAALVGFALPIGATWLGLRALGARSPSDSTAVTAALAIGLGLALAAVGAFVTLTLGARLSPFYVAADGCVWVVIGAFGWRRVRRRVSAVAESKRESSLPLSSQDWAVRAVFVAVALMALAVPITEYLVSPHGQWDAWAIWNQKARFMFRAGPGWTASMVQSWSGPSHPMLVSLAVARLWAYAGAELTIVPAALSLVYGCAVVALVVGALGTRTRRAWVAGAVVMAPFTFSHLVAAQTADLPLGLFVTASLVVLRGGALEGWDTPRAARTMALAGLLGGCAAFTKNEGFVFLAASSVVVAWIAVRHGRFGAAVWWGAAALPLAVLMIWFKLTFPVGTAEYFTEHGGPGPIERAMDMDRLRLIGALAARFWWRWGGGPATGALLATTLVSITTAAAPGEWTGRGLVWVVAAMVVSYYMVWVLSPMETVWLIGSTFDRLMAQVWPTLVLVAASVRLRAQA